MAQAYDFKGVQDKWLPIWDKLEPFKSGKSDDNRPKKYILDIVSLDCHPAVKSLSLLVK